MRVNAPPGAMDKCRRWNVAVKLEQFVHVMSPKPWTGRMESLAYIDDDGRVVARVRRGNGEIVVLAISELRPIGTAYTG